MCVACWTNIDICQNTFTPSPVFGVTNEQTNKQTNSKQTKDKPFKQTSKQANS